MYRLPKFSFIVLAAMTINSLTPVQRRLDFEQLSNIPNASSVPTADPLNATSQQGMVHLRYSSIYPKLTFALIVYRAMQTAANLALELSDPTLNLGAACHLLIRKY